MTTETVWNVTQREPKAVNLIWSEFREQYDVTRKAAAVAFLSELVAEGFENVRMYRTKQVRKFRGGMRLATAIDNVLAA